MSATLDASRFSAYFNDCAVLYVQGRQFPVRYVTNVLSRLVCTSRAQNPRGGLGSPERRVYTKLHQARYRPSCAHYSGHPCCPMQCPLHDRAAARLFGFGSRRLHASTPGRVTGRHSVFFDWPGTYPTLPFIHLYRDTGQWRLPIPRPPTPLVHLLLRAVRMRTACPCFLSHMSLVFWFRTTLRGAPK